MKKLSLASQTLSLAAMALLIGCGGGSGGSSPPPPSTPPPPPAPVAPSGLIYRGADDLKVGVAVNLAPEVSGNPTSYSIANGSASGASFESITGLTFNTATGQITGTPQRDLTAIFVVTASNAVGSTQATVGFAVNFRLQVSYPAESFTFPKGQQLQTVTPAATNGVVNSWSVSPALPPGVNLDPVTGALTGTPTLAFAKRFYKVTAHGLGGNAFEGFYLEVTGTRDDALTMIELGHASSIVELEMQGNRLQSRDESAKVMLWDVASGSSLRSVYSDCPGDPVTPPCQADSELAGNTLAVRMRAGWNLYSATDGALVTSIPEVAGFDSYWSLAKDGSYLVVQGTSGLKAYSSTTGALLLTRNGDYFNAKLYPAPGEIRAGNLANGVQYVENIAVPSGAVTTVPFAEAFHSWFADGEKFFTYTGNTIRVYSRAGVQIDFALLPSLRRLRGRGDWYWLTLSNGQVNIYAVGSGGVSTFTPQTLEKRDEGASTTAGWEMFLSGTGSSIVNLSGTTPIEQGYTSPYPGLRLMTSTSPTQRAFAGGGGVMWTEINGVRKLLTRGRAHSLAASNTYVAVSTELDEILIHDAQTGAYLDTIHDRASRMVMSVDGRVLAIAPDSGSSDPVVRVYDLPSKTIIHEWPVAPAGTYPRPYDFTLSRSGDRIGISSIAVGGIVLSVSTLDGTELWSSPFPISINNEDRDGMRVNLSPDGTRHAEATGADGNPGTTTTLYQGPTLIDALTGWPVGWIDDTHLLINRYIDNYPNEQIFGVQIVDPTGTVLSTPPLPRMKQFQIAGPHAIYWAEFNEIYDTNTGALLWGSYDRPASSLRPLGAVGAGKVFYVSGSQIKSETYP